jgi:acyl-CoA-binding protein
MVLCSEKKELEELRKEKEITLSNTDSSFMNTYMNTYMNTIINMMQKLDEKDKLFEKQQQQINEMIPRLGNNNNNKININVFLHENCKDAINMSEFLDGIKLQIKDFEYIKNNNLQDSIIKVFINNLHQIETCKRPIHCTDVKRETLYIKENNDWSKDKPREKLKKGFLNVVAKYRKKINEWEELHPNWKDNEQMRDEYISLVQKTHTYKYGKTENKLIKNIAKETFIYN